MKNVELDPLLVSAIVAHNEGRIDDAIGVLVQLFEQAAEGGARGDKIHFMTMFLWGQLVEESEAARAILAGIRDRQVAQLLAGDVDFGAQTGPGGKSRFSVIVEINKMLRDSRATYDLFVNLLASSPESMHRKAHMALPVIVEAGDFALADKYLKDPLERLDELKELAQKYPLFPPDAAGPRLAGELANYIKDVVMRAKVLRGLGRKEEAAALESAAVPGLPTDEMRELARRELAAPGTIFRELAERRPPPDAPSPVAS